MFWVLVSALVLNVIRGERRTIERRRRKRKRRLTDYGLEYQS
jgi:hypothetical protein